MLVTHDKWEDALMSRSEDRRLEMSGNRCFRFAETQGRYLFHVDVASGRGETGHAWVHFVTPNVVGLLELIKRGLATAAEIRVTLQTPFSEQEPYAMTQVLEIFRGADEMENEVFACNCENGKGYILTQAPLRRIWRVTTVWP
jgi:hypothetical protein